MTRSRFKLKGFRATGITRRLIAVQKLRINPQYQHKTGTTVFITYSLNAKKKCFYLGPNSNPLIKIEYTCRCHL